MLPRAYLPCSAIAVVLLILACGDDATAPPPGSTTDTILSSADPQAWQLQILERPEPGDSVVVLPDRFKALASSANDGSATVDFELTGKNRLDLTPYTACRLRFDLSASVPRRSYPNYRWSRATITLRSNVPGTDDLQVFDRQCYADADSTYDISLENALGFGEATMVIQLTANVYSIPSDPIATSMSLSGVRLTGTK